VPSGGVTLKRRCTYRPSVIYLIVNKLLSLSLSFSLNVANIVVGGIDDGASHRYYHHTRWEGNLLFEVAKCQSGVPIRVFKITAKGSRE